MDPSDPFDEANPAMHYDGGWERMVDDGHELEDLQLGPVHPYDRPDGYTPAHRWGTRHSLTVRSYNDPISAAETGDWEALRLLGRRPPHQPVDGLERHDGRGRASAGRRPSKPQAKRSRAARRIEAAQALNVSVHELKGLRQSYAAAQAATKGVPKGQRRQAIASYLGWSLAYLGRYEATHSGETATSRQEPSSVRRYATQNWKLGDIAMADLSRRGLRAAERCRVVLVHIAGASVFVRVFDKQKSRNALFVTPSILNGLPWPAYLRKGHLDLKKTALRNKIGTLEPHLAHFVLYKKPSQVARAQPAREVAAQAAQVRQLPSNASPTPASNTTRLSPSGYDRQAFIQDNWCPACSRPIDFRGHCGCS